MTIRRHAFYLPGISTDFVFTPSPGSFTVHNDGTATLTGTLHSKSNPANGFTVTVTFSGYTTTAPPDSRGPTEPSPCAPWHVEQLAAKTCSPTTSGLAAAAAGAAGFGVGR